MNSIIFFFMGTACLVTVAMVFSLCKINSPLSREEERKEFETTEWCDGFCNGCSNWHCKVRDEEVKK